MQYRYFKVSDGPAWDAFLSLRKERIAVPWRDMPKKEMNDYRRKHKKGEWSSAEHEYLSWTPAASLKEMKEWEALKLIDELTPAKEKQS